MPTTCDLMSLNQIIQQFDVIFDKWWGTKKMFALLIRAETGCDVANNELDAIKTHATACDIKDLDHDWNVAACTLNKHIRVFQDYQ